MVWLCTLGLKPSFKESNNNNSTVLQFAILAILSCSTPAGSLDTGRLVGTTRLGDRSIKPGIWPNIDLLPVLLAQMKILLNWKELPKLLVELFSVLQKQIFPTIVYNKTADFFYRSLVSILFLFLGIYSCNLLYNNSK